MQSYAYKFYLYIEHFIAIYGQPIVTLVVQSMKRQKSFSEQGVINGREAPSL